MCKKEEFKSVLKLKNVKNTALKKSKRDQQKYLKKNKFCKIQERIVLRRMHKMKTTQSKNYISRVFLWS